LQKKKQLLHKGGKSHGLREQAREKVWKRREKSLFIDGKVKKKLKKKFGKIKKENCTVHIATNHIKTP
jgi:hypothetical protein